MVRLSRGCGVDGLLHYISLSLSHSKLQALGFAWCLQACKANGHALLAKSGEQRGGRGEEEALNFYNFLKAQMSAVPFHFIFTMKIKEKKDLMAKAHYY